jgi:nitroreductase
MAIQSTANAGLALLFAAHAEKLGGVWMCSPLFAAATVRRVLHLPTAWEPQALFLIGPPAEIPRPKRRKPLKDVLVFA